MTDKNKQILKSIINYVTSIITAIFIFMLCAVIAFGVLTDKKYIKHTVKNADYIELSANELKEDMISLAIPSGLPENFFDDKIYLDLLSLLNNQSIDNTYDYGKFSVDTAKIKESYIAEFKKYAESGALASDVDVTEEGLQYLGELCAEKYEKIAANSVFKYLSFYSGKVNKFFPMALGVTILICIFCIIFLIKLGKANNDKRFIYFSVCGAGLMTAIAPLFVLLGGFIKKISITSRAMHLFIISLVNNILILLVVLGFVLIVSSLFILCLKKKDAKIQKNS